MTDHSHLTGICELNQNLIDLLITRPSSGAPRQFFKRFAEFFSSRHASLVVVNCKVVPVNSALRITCCERVVEIVQ